MKRVYLLLLLLLTYFSTLAQKQYEVVGNGIQITKIYENTGMNIEQCHDTVFSHFASVFNDSNHTCKMNTPTELIYKGVFSKVVFFSIAWRSNVDFEVRVSIKENRMRVVVFADRVHSYTTESPNTASYYLVDAAPLAEKHNAWKTCIPQNKAEELFDKTLTMMNAVIAGLDKSMTRKPSNDNW